MSVTVIQPQTDIRKNTLENNQRYGIKGKQILESNSVNEARSLINSGRKNFIINGNFDIWQRNTTQTSSGYGSADRWHNYQGASTKTITKENFIIGQTDVPGNPSYFCRTNVISASTVASWVINQYFIEDLFKFNRKTLTLSFWAKADAPKNIGLEVIFEFGSGGSSTILGKFPALFELSTEWQYFTYTFIMPPLESFTFGTNNFLNLNFWLEGGSNYISRNGGMINQDGIFDIAQVQLEEGNNATDFEYRPIAEELALCQRYYQKSYDLNIIPGNFDINGIKIEYPTRNNASTMPGLQFKNRMRTVPTVIIYSPFTGAAGNVSNVTTGIDNIATATNIGETGWSTTNLSTALTSDELIFHYTADAEL